MNSEILNFVFLLIIVAIAYFIYVEHNNYNNTKKNKKKNYKNHKKHRTSKNDKKKINLDVQFYDDLDNHFDQLDDYQSDGNYDKSDRLNRELLNTQYHVDYRDTISGINYLTSQKELFNLGFLPAKDVIPDKNVIDDLTNLFVDRLNHEIKHTVTEYREVNSGWNDMGKDKRVKSGFEEEQEELGLPSTIYNEGAKKEMIELIHVQRAVQTNTDDQARIDITMVLQKPHVKDQMVVKVFFFMEKEDMKNNRDDRDNFFGKDINRNINDKEISDQEIVIEQVFIVGFLTNEGEPQTNMDKFYNYENIKNVDGTLDQSKVIKVMLQKQRERSKEHSSFLCTLADEDKQIHDVNSIGDTESYKLTRTIVDDLKQFPHQSFGDITI